MKITFGDHEIKSVFKATTPIKAIITNRSGTDNLLFPTSIRYIQTANFNLAANYALVDRWQGPTQYSDQTNMHCSVGTFTFNSRLVDTETDYDDLTIFVRMDLFVKNQAGDVVYTKTLADHCLYFLLYGETKYRWAGAQEKIREFLNPAGVPAPSAGIGILYDPNTPPYSITSNMTATLVITAYQKERNLITQVAIRDYGTGTDQGGTFTIPTAAIVQSIKVTLVKTGGTTPLTFFLKQGGSIIYAGGGNNGDVIDIDPNAVPLNVSITLEILDNPYSGSYLSATIVVTYLTA